MRTVCVLTERTPHLRSPPHHRLPSPGRSHPATHSLNCCIGTACPKERRRLSGPPCTYSSRADARRRPPGRSGSVGTLGLTGAWIVLGGVVLGALIAGGVALLTDKLADDHARHAKRKEHAASIGAECLREVDGVQQHLLDGVHEHGAVPGDDGEWGETPKVARIAQAISSTTRRQCRCRACGRFRDMGIRR